MWNINSYKFEIFPVLFLKYPLSLASWYRWYLKYLVFCVHIVSWPLMLTILVWLEQTGVRSAGVGARYLEWLVWSGVPAHPLRVRGWRAGGSSGWAGVPHSRGEGKGKEKVRRMKCPQLISDNAEMESYICMYPVYISFEKQEGLSEQLYFWCTEWDWTIGWFRAKPRAPSGMFIVLTIYIQVAWMIEWCQHFT